MIGPPIVITAPKIKTEHAVASMWAHVMEEIKAIDPGASQYVIPRV
jgi:hypothetical protein